MRHGHAGARLTAPDLKQVQAAAQDAADPLAGFAHEFHHPHDSNGRKLLYFGGHSLGLQPKSAAAMIEQELQDWRRLGVLGHTAAARPWIPYHERAAPALAELTGAMEGEVVAMNSLSVNLHLMMVSFFRPDATRNTVLIESSAFPSDRYAVVSQLEFHGLEPARSRIEIQPRPGERTLRTEDVIERIEREGARLSLVLLPGVQYLTGQLLDMPALIAAARRVGACFVHERHARNFRLPRFAGWWGHNKAERFLYDPKFDPIAGAQGWQISNPPILSTAPLLASLEIFQRAGMRALRAKSIALTGFLQRLIEERLPKLVEIITPTPAEQRGCQLSVRLARPAAEARRCQEALTAAGVIGDWREPDVLRLAPIALQLIRRCV